jgi:hypothetical protein
MVESGIRSRAEKLCCGRSLITELLAAATSQGAAYYTVIGRDLQPSACWDWVWDWVWVSQGWPKGHPRATQGPPKGHPRATQGPPLGRMAKVFCLQQKFKNDGWGREESP